MVMIAGFCRTTIMLIAVCALGVTGHIDTLSVHDDGMIAWTDARVTMAWGGFVVFNTEFSKVRPDIMRHEFGHLAQEEKYGCLYEILVVIPSLISAIISDSPEAHDSRWFEIEATELGRR